MKKKDKKGECQNWMLVRVYHQIWLVDRSVSRIRWCDEAIIIRAAFNKNSLNMLHIIERMEL